MLKRQKQPSHNEIPDFDDDLPFFFWGLFPLGQLFSQNVSDNFGELVREVGLHERKLVLNAAHSLCEVCERVLHVVHFPQHVAANGPFAFHVALNQRHAPPKFRNFAFVTHGGMIGENRGFVERAH
jgi:hypothetical protein